MEVEVRRSMDCVVVTVTNYGMFTVFHEWVQEPNILERWLGYTYQSKIDEAVKRAERWMIEREKRDQYLDGLVANETNRSR
jgi:hypothetical protein